MAVSFSGRATAQDCARRRSTSRVDEHLVRAEYKIVLFYRRLSKRVLPYDCTRWDWGGLASIANRCK